MHVFLAECNSILNFQMFGESRPTKNQDVCIHKTHSRDCFILPNGALFFFEGAPTSGTFATKKQIRIILHRGDHVLFT